MGLMIELTPEEEACLRTAAEQEGMEPAECARRLLVAQLSLGASSPPLKPGDATRALFAAWDEEDATDDPDEIARRVQEWEELKAGLNANRAVTDERLLFP